MRMSQYQKALWFVRLAPKQSDFDRLKRLRKAESELKVCLEDDVHGVAGKGNALIELQRQRQAQERERARAAARREREQRERAGQGGAGGDKAAGEGGEQVGGHGEKGKGGRGLGWCQRGLGGGR